MLQLARTTSTIPRPTSLQLAGIAISGVAFILFAAAAIFNTANGGGVTHWVYLFNYWGLLVTPLFTILSLLKPPFGELGFIINLYFALFKPDTTYRVADIICIVGVVTNTIGYILIKLKPERNVTTPAALKAAIPYIPLCITCVIDLMYIFYRHRFSRILDASAHAGAGTPLPWLAVIFGAILSMLGIGEGAAVPIVMATRASAICDMAVWNHGLIFAFLVGDLVVFCAYLLVLILIDWKKKATPFSQLFSGPTGYARKLGFVLSLVPIPAVIVCLFINIATHTWNRYNMTMIIWGTQLIVYPILVLGAALGSEASSAVGFIFLSQILPPLLPYASIYSDVVRWVMLMLTAVVGIVVFLISQIGDIYSTYKGSPGTSRQPAPANLTKAPAILGVVCAGLHVGFNVAIFIWTARTWYLGLAIMLGVATVRISANTSYYGLDAIFFAWSTVLAMIGRVLNQQHSWSANGQNFPTGWDLLFILDVIVCAVVLVLGLVKLFMQPYQQEGDENAPLITNDVATPTVFASQEEACENSSLILAEKATGQYGL